MIKNYFKNDTLYKVETDIPNIGGETEIVVPGNGTFDYKITIAPQVCDDAPGHFYSLLPLIRLSCAIYDRCRCWQLGGVYTGAITFTAATGEYMWFPVEINAGSPQAESAIDVSAKVREAVALDLQVDNPLSER